MSERAGLYQARRDAVAGAIASAVLVFISVALILAARTPSALADTELRAAGSILVVAGIVGCIAGLIGLALIIVWTRLPRW